MNLSTPIENIVGIGPVFQKRLKKLGIKTIQDLFFHFPRRYEDFSNLIPISKLKINEICTLQGKITFIETSRSWKKRIYITEAIIEDKSGAIKAVWFNQPYLTKTLKTGDNVFLSGKVTISKNGNESDKETILRVSRERYTVPRDIIEEKINSWFGK